jgi:SSS family solute:Na+ symporter
MQTPTYLAAGLRLPTNGLDYAILGIYFAVVLGIGFAARRSVKTSLDFFLSGRSLPAWITGLAFISANLAATEILGMAANSAQHGAYTVHWYWIGAIPAMVFLGRDWFGGQDGVGIQAPRPSKRRVMASSRLRPCLAAVDR